MAVSMLKRRTGKVYCIYLKRLFSDFYQEFIFENMFICLLFPLFANAVGKNKVHKNCDRCELKKKMADVTRKLL